MYADAELVLPRFTEMAHAVASLAEGGDGGGVRAKVAPLKAIGRTMEKGLTKHHGNFRKITDLDSIRSSKNIGSMLAERRILLLRYPPSRITQAAHLNGTHRHPHASRKRRIFWCNSRGPGVRSTP